MKFKNFQNKEMASQYVGDSIISQIQMNPKTILGLATGSTPLELYDYLAKKTVELGLSWKEVITFNLDEYKNIDHNNKNSYHQFMKDNLFSKIPSFDMKNSYFPNDETYDELIRSKGGIDIQILGIGNNGHIGFNEPGSSIESTTREVALDNSTIEANKRFFNSIEEVPTSAITVGIKTILEAKKIFLLSFGKSKAKVINDLKKISTFDIDLPASALLNHSNSIIVIDEESNYNE